jgi:copper chaperone CopZ
MDRVRSTLKNIEGVLHYDINTKERSLIIDFDDKVTSVAKIAGQLAESGYSISGQPQMIR